MLRFTNFWDIYVRERIKSETQVKETHPGKILSQGDLEYHGGLVNDRGQVLASGKIYNPNEPSAKVQNLAEWGLLVLMSVVIRSGLIIGGEVAGDSITSVNGLAVMPTKESLIHHWI